MCGALAVVWGVLSGARIILFDGAYALIGIGIAGLSLRIAHAVAAGPTRRFPFGRDAGPLARIWSTPRPSSGAPTRSSAP